MRDGTPTGVGGASPPQPTSAGEGQVRRLQRLSVPTAEPASPVAPDQVQAAKPGSAPSTVTLAAAANLLTGNTLKMVGGAAGSIQARLAPARAVFESAEAAGDVLRAGFKRYALATVATVGAANVVGRAAAAVSLSYEGALLSGTLGGAAVAAVLGRFAPGSSRILGSSASTAFAGSVLGVHAADEAWAAKGW